MCYNSIGDNMLYLKKFELPNRDREENMLMNDCRTYIQGVYPFNIFPNKELQDISFAPITIFYGGNGSGKSTLLNVIAEKIKATRNNPFVGGERFESYLRLCQCEMTNNIPYEIKTISSDDIFDYVLNIRRINHGLYNRRSEVAKEYITGKYRSAREITDYQEMVDAVDARRKTMSRFIRDKVIVKDIQEQSNGESALMYFASYITDNGLYILDEPENSMSASMQIKLAKFIEDSARFFNCQFIIATHSPFILGIKDAVIYDLDSKPAIIKEYANLENMQVYYDFFKLHAAEFEKNI